MALDYRQTQAWMGNVKRYVCAQRHRLAMRALGTLHRRQNGVFSAASGTGRDLVWRASQPSAEPQPVARF